MPRGVPKHTQFSRLLEDLESAGDRDDNGCLIWKYYCTAKAKYNDFRGYGTLNVRGTTAKTHRVVYHYYVDPTFPIWSDDRSVVIDHRCRISNCYEPNHLFKASNRENTIWGSIGELRENASSKYTGVCWDTRQGKWKSAIWFEGKTNYLGHYDNEIDASNAYQVFYQSRVSIKEKGMIAYV